MDTCAGPDRALADSESGKTFIVMLLVILPVLLLVLGVAHDLGNAAVGVTIAQNAADLGAQEAGKVIDAGYFAQYQEIRLRQPEAAYAAADVAADLTEGTFQVDDVYIRNSVVVVEGRVTVRTPFLRTFLGIPSITRQVQGVAEAAYRARGDPDAVR